MSQIQTCLLMSMKTLQSFFDSPGIYQSSLTHGFGILHHGLGVHVIKQIQYGRHYTEYYAWLSWFTCEIYTHGLKTSHYVSHISLHIVYFFFTWLLHMILLLPRVIFLHNLFSFTSNFSREWLILFILFIHIVHVYLSSRAISEFKSEMHFHIVCFDMITLYTQSRGKVRNS